MTYSTNHIYWLPIFLIQYDVDNRQSINTAAVAATATTPTIIKQIQIMMKISQLLIYPFPKVKLFSFFFCSTKINFLYFKILLYFSNIHYEYLN